MDNTVENVIVVSNLIETTKAIIMAVGFEYQAPLDESVLDEIISSQVMAVVEDELKKGNK